MKSYFGFFKKPVKSIPVDRVRIEWNRIRKDYYQIDPNLNYENLKDSMYKDHGFLIPDPFWSWRDMGIDSHFDLSLDGIFTEIQMDNLQIALTRKAGELNLSTATDDFWTAYSFYTPTLIELYSVPDGKIEEFAKINYLYNWYHRGGQKDESSIDLGHACCHLQIFIKPRRFLLAWWERETRILNDMDLKNWTDAVEKELNQVFQQWQETQGREYIYFERFVMNFLSRAHPFTQKARSESINRDLYFYQNPRWEKIYARQEGIDWVKRYFAKNRHPDSFKWLEGNKD